MRVAIVSIAAAAMLGLLSAPVQATPITRTYEFTATDWFIQPPTPPVGTLVGSVTLTFDTDDTSLTEQTSDILLNSLNVTLGSTLGFLYDPTGFASATGIESLFIGGVSNGVGTVTPGENDFGILIENPSSSSPSLAIALLSTADPAASWRSETGTVSVVPAPATLVLMSLGLAGIGYTRHCSKKAA